MVTVVFIIEASSTSEAALCAHMNMRVSRTRSDFH